MYGEVKWYVLLRFPVYGSSRNAIVKVGQLLKSVHIYHTTFRELRIIFVTTITFACNNFFV